MSEARKVSAREMRSKAFSVDRERADAFRKAYRSKTTEPTGKKQKKKEGAPVKIDAVVKTEGKMKVAAYCRVSTLYESQESSIAAQREHYEKFIRSNKEWEFAGIYLEAGVSGTKTEKRPQLQKLIQDCRAGKVNLILTKNISRFARNTSDCLAMVRELMALGVNVRFEKEQIDTSAMESEFFLSILACLAEDESHSISGNMKWGIRKRFESGTYKQVFAPYGYEYQGKKLVIVPETAEVVRRIFRMTLCGNGVNTIAKVLNRDGVPSPSGREWTTGTLHDLIKNPAYIGDMLYQKTYKDENFKQKKNKGQLDQYYDSGHHEPIISKEDFENAQYAVLQRAKEVGYSDNSENRRSSNQYCFRGILFCKNCGTVMHRQIQPGGVVWICHMHVLDRNRCRMKPQWDVDLKAAFINCMNKLAWSQSSRTSGERLLDNYEDMLERTRVSRNADRLYEIESLLEETSLENRKLTTAIMRDGFLADHARMRTALEEKEKTLSEERNAILLAGETDSALLELKRYVVDWVITDRLDSFPEERFSEFVKSCTVDSHHTVTFHFQCGLDLSESLERTEVR